MDKKNTSTLLKALAIIIIIIGVIVAFTAELNNTTIHNGTEIPTQVSTHILVIMLFVFVSGVLLLTSIALTQNKKRITASYIILFLAYGITGLFFSIASAYKARADLLLDWYYEMKSLPTWYMGDVLDEIWFESVPTVANSFSSTATIFFILTTIGAICLLYFANQIIKTGKLSFIKEN